MMYLSTDVYRDDSAGINYTIHNTLLSQPALTVIAGSGHYRNNDEERNNFNKGVYAIGYQMCTTDQEKVCYISNKVILPYVNFSLYLHIYAMSCNMNSTHEWHAPSLFTF